jgi:hypothetical protein
MKYLVKDENGAAMFVVLLVLLLLIILSSVFVFAMVTEGTQSAKYDDLTKAYYLARSGAELGLEKVLHDYSGDLINALESNVNIASSYTGDLQSLNQGTLNNKDAINLTITKNSGDQFLTIEATGRVTEGIERKVKLKIDKELSQSSGNWGDYALLSKESITIKGSASISGINPKVGTKLSQEDASGKIDVPSGIEVDYNVDRVFPEYTDLFPIVNSPQKFNATTDYVNGKINENKHFSEIDTDIIIYTGSVASDERFIRVGELDLTGNKTLDAQGEGRLHLLVTSGIDHKGNSVIKASGNAKVIVYLLFDVTSNNKIAGNSAGKVLFYSPNHKIEATGASTINGAIIAKDVELDGNASLTYGDWVEEWYYDYGGAISEPRFLWYD